MNRHGEGVRGFRIARAAAALTVAGLAIGSTPAGAAWQPSKPVEFIVMGGPGGGSDQLAQFISAMVEKHKLAPVPLIPINKGGGGGALAMDHVRGEQGNSHMIMIAHAPLFMLPITQKLPFNYKNFTPISLFALDNFFLWVHKDSPWKTVKEFVTEAQKRSITAGGSGSKREEQVILAFLEQRAGLKPFKYVPFRGGGETAGALVGKHVEATANQPAEALPHYPDKLRMLATFAAERHKGFPDLPTMKELGYDVSYRMMRGILGPPGMPAEARDYYAGLMRKVYDLKEFQDHLYKGVLDPQFMSGDEFARWIADQHTLHDQIIKKAGW
ncbi:MAG: Bug family tripartite tricarboxylate transporter substrate binding protein [Candidatus Rokuibacteriota bacterium]